MQDIKTFTNKSRINSWIITFALCTFILILLILSILISFRGGINFDEAYILQAPSSLVTQDTYRTTYDGGKVLDAGLTTGPTVLLPIGLVFKLFGIGIYQARVIALLYFLSMLIITYFVSKTLYDSVTAFYILLFILLLPHMFFFGLKVLGEIPTAFFILIACLYLVKDKPFLFGIFLGLAFLTKFIFVLLIPTVFLLFLVEFFFSKKYRKQSIQFYFKVIIGLLLPFLIWEGYKLYELGIVGYQNHIQDFLDNVKVVSGTDTIFSIQTINDRLLILATPFSSVPHLVVFALIILVIIHNLLQISRLWKLEKWDTVNRARLFLIIFGMVYLSWWIFGKHFNWWRYLFAGYIILMLLVGNSFSSLIRWLGKFISASPANNRPLLISRYTMGFAVIIGFSIPMILVPAHSQILRLKSSLSREELDTQFLVAREVSQIEEMGGRIAYWGWWQSPEISFLSQSRFKDLLITESRQELDSLVSQHNSVYVLISPTQSSLSPIVWTEEKAYCGDMIFQLNGYKLYEYIPTYFRTYNDYLSQRRPIPLSNSYDLNGRDTLDDFYTEGFYDDGWIGRAATIWLNNDQGSKILRIEGTININGFKNKQDTIIISAMGMSLDKKPLSENGSFLWEFTLPQWTESFKALRIEIESNKVFTPEAIGIIGDQRKVSVVITKIELR